MVFGQRRNLCIFSEKAFRLSGAEFFAVLENNSGTKNVSWTCTHAPNSTRISPSASTINSHASQLKLASL